MIRAPDSSLITPLGEKSLTNPRGSLVARVFSDEVAMTDRSPSTEERWREIMRELSALGYSREQIDAIPTEPRASY